MADILTVRGVERRFQTRPGAAGHRPRCRRERLHHHPRPQRLRQEHAAAHRRRARSPDRRRGDARRPAHRRPRRRPRHGVPELHLVPVADGARQRLLRPARARPAAGRATGDRQRLPGQGGAARLREPLPEAALGRHAAARGDCPRAGQRPAHAADGRALRRARPPDPRADAGAAARHLGGREARPCCSSPTTSTRRSSWAAASS